MIAQSRPKRRTALRALALVLLVPLGLYLAAAGILSHIPVNRDWREPPSGVTIYVMTNGFHTGIVVPQNAAGIDWRTRVRATDLRDTAGAGRWLGFGWGDRDFYLNTPTWAEFDIATAAGAVIGGGRTLVHVDHFDDFASDENYRPLRLTPDQYRRLAAFIDATFADTREVIPGYGPRDAFYAARGSFGAFRTCNIWVGEALKAAEVRTAAWTPFEGGIMRWVPRPPQQSPPMPLRR